MIMASPVYTWRALAALLEYPSQALLDNLGALRAAIAEEGIADPVLLAPLLERLSAEDLIELQSDYVDTFDRGRSTSLLLFEHVHGESRDRGQAMIDLKAQYAQAGLEVASTQLPDYLPMFLEYCSMLPREDAQDAIDEIAHIGVSIGRALRRRGSPYAAVFAALAAVAGGSLDESQEERAARTGQAGPGAAASAPAAGFEDWMPEAMDAAWVEEPVTFMGACAPQQPAVQPVQWLDRKPARAGEAAPRRVK